MADVKISELPAASTPLAGTEQIPLVQSSTTKKITVSNLLTSANLGTPTAVNLANATNVPMAQASGVLPVVNGGSGTATPSIVAGSNVTVSGSWPNQTIAATAGGSGTVTSASVVSANGLAGTVATATTTPAITLSTTVTGVVKGNGTALSAATAGTDYVAPGGVLGTPSSGTATNLTGLPLTTGVTGQLPVANGGTGTASPSIVAGTNVTVSGTWPNQTINATGGAGSGDVSGPASSTDNAVARFDSTTGKIIQNSSVVINDGGEITTGVWKGTEIGLSYGGTGGASASQARSNILPSYTGNAGKVLAVNTGATDVEYISAGGTGTVTSVGTGTGLTGGPVTASGTISLANTAVTAGTYSSANITVDAQGRITAAANGSSGITYPGAGIANSTGSAWGTSYTTSGTGTVVALATGAALTNPSANQINDTNGAQILGLSPTTSAVDYLVVKNGTGVGVPLHVYADGASANTGLHIQPKGTGLVTISDGTDFNKGIRFRSSSSAASAVTLLDAVSTAGRVVTLPDATTTLVGRDTTDTLTNKTINLTSNTLVATSAQMAAAVSDETGSGSLVFATSPTLVTPLLGTPTSGDFSTGTFTWPTFNQNTTGTASNVTGTVAIANGGTGQTTAAAAITALTGTQTSGQYLRSDGTNAALGAIQAGDVPTLNQNTTGSAGSVANALTAGTGISFSAGSTYNGSAAITINNSGVAVYPGAGISVSTGSAWGTSLTAPSGAIVGTTDTQTLTNKTLTNPTITNYTETAFSANSSTAITLALTNGTVQIITLTGNATITMPAAGAGKSFIMFLRQDATGSRTVTWSTVNWPGGTAPTITSTASKQDIYSFFSDGTSWYGVNVAQNYTQ